MRGGAETMKEDSKTSMIKFINGALQPEKWSEQAKDAFLLGYAVGKEEGRKRAY